MSESNIAVRVSSVSKIYRLWNSPRARLAYPLKRLLNSLLPQFLRNDEELGKDVHEFHALEDISFEIRKGESWGFIGVNGSGKSTLLKIISGNLRPSSGTVEVEGKTTILDYSSGLNGEFTGRENVYHKGTLLGLTKKQVEERFQSIEDFADIGEFIDQPVKVYSSGMTARLGFAIMSHVDADILITDEALAVGDAFFVQKCMRYIHEFLSKGTFLFVSHSVNDVMTLCNKAIWLEQGRVVKSGPAGDVCRAYLDSNLRRNSETHLQTPAATNDHENTPSDPDDTVADENSIRQAPRSIPNSLSLTAEQLAELKNHYAPRIQRTVPQVASHFEITSPSVSATNSKNVSVVGGGRIFSVELADKKGSAVSFVLGGEIVTLTVRVVAERAIRRPLIGFQLKNSLGLALVAENNELAISDNDFTLIPGDVVSISFTFMMPLLAAGEYVVRAAFHDGDGSNNVAIDVMEDALLLCCTTSGERHGLVGTPIFNIEITRLTDHAIESGNP